MEHFEYWLKLVEAAVVMYIGIDRWHYLAGISGYSNSNGDHTFSIDRNRNPFLLCESRLFYLKNKGLLPDERSAIKIK